MLTSPEPQSKTVPTKLANEVKVTGNSYALIWTGMDSNYMMEHFTMEDHAEVSFMSGTSDPFTVYVG